MYVEVRTKVREKLNVGKVHLRHASKMLSPPIRGDKVFFLRPQNSRVRENIDAERKNVSHSFPMLCPTERVCTTTTFAHEKKDK